MAHRPDGRQKYEKFRNSFLDTETVVRTPFAYHPNAAQRTPILSRISFSEAYK
jgi:hypothetical protein